MSGVAKPAGDWFIVLNDGTDDEVVIGPYETRNKAHIGRLQYVGNKSLNGDTPYTIQRDPALKAKIDASLPALKAHYMAHGKTEEDWEKFYDVCVLRREKSPQESTSRPAVPAEGPKRAQAPRVPAVRAPEDNGYAQGPLEKVVAAAPIAASLGTALFVTAAVPAGVFLAYWLVQLAYWLSQLIMS